MFFTSRIRFGEWGILFLLAFTVLWKGGKSLESVWLLTGLACVLTLSYWLNRASRRQNISKQLESKNGQALARKEFPIMLWALSLLFILWNVLSYFFSSTKNYGLDDVLRACSCVFIFLWVARIHIDQEEIKMQNSFPQLVTWATIAASLMGIITYIFQPVSRFVGTFFDYRYVTDYWPNAWAEFSLLAWPMVLLLAWRKADNRNLLIWYPLLGFVLSGLFLSYSRGAFLALIGQLCIASILLIAVLLRDIRYRRNALRIAAAIATRAAVVFVVAGICFISVNALRSRYHEVESISKKATFTSAEGRSSIDERSQFWNQALVLTKEHPLTGWGPYSFRFVQPALMHDVFATSDHPHNVFLKLAMEEGIPSAALFLLLFGTVVSFSVLSFFRTRKSTNPASDAFTILSIAAVSGLLLHNLIDFNLQFVSICLSAGIIVALLVSPSLPVITKQEDTFRRWRIRRFLSQAEVFLALLLLIVAVWEGFFLMTSSFGRHAMDSGDAEGALQWFERSHMEFFSRDLYLSEAQLYAEQKEYDAALQSTARYIALNTYDPRGWKFRGELQIRSGNPDLAVESLERAYVQGKYTDAGILRWLLEAVRATKKDDEYASRKLEFDALFAQYADAIEHNTHFIALSQNVEELQQISRLLAALYPVDAQRYKAIARSAAGHAKEERDAAGARREGMLW